MRTLKKTRQCRHTLKATFEKGNATVVLNRVNHGKIDKILTFLSTPIYYKDTARIEQLELNIKYARNYLILKEHRNFVSKSL